MDTLFGEPKQPSLADFDVADGRTSGDEPALKLGKGDEPHREDIPEALTEPLADQPPAFPAEPIDNSRALALSDVITPRTKPGEALIRMAYRMGVPGHTIAAPFRKAPAKRLLATVESPLTGSRASGIALRAGHFQVHGVKQPIGTLDFTAGTRLAPGLERSVHSFSWLADLAACAPLTDGAIVAERITKGWLDAHEARSKASARSAAWDVENAGLRLLAWLTHAPLLMSGELRPRLLDAIEDTAHWLDRKALRSGAGSWPGCRLGGCGGGRVAATGRASAPIVWRGRSYQSTWRIGRRRWRRSWPLSSCANGRDPGAY